MRTSATYHKLTEGDDTLTIVGDESGEGNGSIAGAKRTCWKRPSVFWLLPSVVLFSLSMGATAMPRTNVIISLICRSIISNDAVPGSSVIHTRSQIRPRHGESMGHMGANATLTADMTMDPTSIIIGEYNPQCAFDQVESATAMMTLWGNLIASILCTVSAPVWGILSDRYGRVKPLAIMSVLLLLAEIWLLIVASAPDRVHYTWIHLSFFLEGLSGTFIALMALLSSYASDCTPSDKRMEALGFFHGSMFFGMSAGPLLGGILAKIGGDKAPLLVFYIALSMRVVGILVLVHFVPESLTKQRIRSTHLLSSIDPRQLFRNLIVSHSDPDMRRNITILVFINVIMFGAMMGAMNVTLLYSEFVFHWGNMESGTFLSVVNFCRTIATGLVLPYAVRLSRHLTRRQRLPAEEGGMTQDLDHLDVWLLRVSIISDFLGYVGYALAPTGGLFTMSGIIGAVGAIGLATSEASLTKLVGHAQTGEFLGALGFLQSLARIVAPTIANAAYSWTAESAPTVVFWGVTVSFGLAGVLTLFLQTHR